MSRFPARLSAAGIRFSVIRFPPRDRLSSRSAHRPKRAGPRRGYRVPHARAATGVGAPYTPRTVVLTRPGRLPDRHPPLPSGSPSTPPQHPTMRGSASRGINRGSSTFTRPVFPSPTPPGWNRRRFGVPPELRTPPLPAAHVRGGDRPSSTDLELPLNSHPSNLQSGSSLNTCDLASHGEEQVRRGVCVETRIRWRVPGATVVAVTPSVRTQPSACRSSGDRVSDEAARL